MNEVWKPVVGHEGYYEVSSRGRIRSLPRKVACKDGRMISKPGVYLKPRFTDYARVSLSKDGKSKYNLVHRLVADSFVPNPMNYRCVNHIDANKFNNVPENLEWCTHSQNSKHAYINELWVPKVGEQQWKATLSNNQIKEMRAMFANGVPQYELVRHFAVSKHVVSRAVRGVTWKSIL